MQAETNGPRRLPMCLLIAQHLAIPERYLNALLDSMNSEALESIACNLRNEVSCQIPALTLLDKHARFDLVNEQMGGQNLHLDIIFEDGVV
jgi:hypothetical protein